MVIDYIRVRARDRSQVSVLATQHGLVVQTQTVLGQETKTVSFEDYPELRAVYDSGWQLDELTAMIEQIDMRRLGG